MKNKIDKKVLFSIIIGIILSLLTNVVAETLIKSADVSYIDNSNLKATNVQAAIDGTCTKFSNDLATLQTTIINKIYPVGSIYISYNSTNPSTFLGGTWEAFGKGQTLVGIDASQKEFDTVGKTGGEKTHTLTIDEMPSHTHEQNPHTHILPYTSNAGKGFEGYGFEGGGSNITNGNGIAVMHATAINKNTGGSKAHNNLQPYITVYMWKRKS